MIGRHWCGRATAEDADGYVEHLRLSTLPQLQRIDGHRGAYVLRRDEGDGVACVLTLWDTHESVRAFAGGRQVGSVRVPPGSPRTLRVPLRPSGGVCVARFTVSPTAIPAVVTGGQNPDPRVLGIHFTRFTHVPRA